jgi:TonB family protein
MLEMKPRMELAKPQSSRASGQTVRLLTALTLLLVALTVVIVRDREFWFGSDEASESNAAGPENTPKPQSPAAPAKTAQGPLAQAATAKNHSAPKTPAQSVTVPAQNDAAGPVPPVVATNRVVLPPLDVEVVAGDTHRTVHAGSNVTKVEIPSNSNRTSAVTASGLTLPMNAAEHARLSSVSVPELRQTVDATYPLLGQHMKVQGSVVLQAVVAADGTIENLRVLSGPAILAPAAQQAVREWRFKPYIQNGQAVETKAKITVNFSIRVSDNANAS